MVAVLRTHTVLVRNLNLNLGQIVHGESQTDAPTSTRFDRVFKGINNTTIRAENEVSILNAKYHIVTRKAGGRAEEILFDCDRGFVGAAETNQHTRRNFDHRRRS